MTSPMIQQEPNRTRVAIHGRDRHFVSLHVRDRFIPVVMTASNTSSTHNNSATGPFCETWMCCGE